MSLLFQDSVFCPLVSMYIQSTVRCLALATSDVDTSSMAIQELTIRALTTGEGAIAAIGTHDIDPSVPTDFSAAGVLACVRVGCVLSSVCTHVFLI